MILNASQRGGGMALAAHLLKDENEHVEVHEIRGFVSNDLKGAMKEAQAVAVGTRCKQHLFSVSLNPPPSAAVSVDKFEAAIERIEQANGLTGQPRMIVFHEKEGCRHAHAVWSRIDPDTMTARPLSHFKLKLREVSKALYLEHGWQMPRGYIKSSEFDPRNFRLAEWQQAKRMGRDPAQLKATAQECWAASDNAASFGKALEARGLYLARGDRRGYVAVTHEGEVLVISRLIGKRTKEVAAKLGPSDQHRSVTDVKRQIAETVAPRLKALVERIKIERKEALAPLHDRRDALTDRHTSERQKLDEGQRLRSAAETRERASRLRAGVAGLWDRLTGRHGETAKRNDAEALAGLRRDRSQRDDLVAGQLAERRDLQREIVATRERYARRALELFRDAPRQREARADSRESLRLSFGRAASSRSIQRPSVAGRDTGGIKPRGSDLGR